MKYLLLALALTTTANAAYISVETIIKAEEYCYEHGGIYGIEVHDEFIQVDCDDGRSFTVKED